MRRIGVFSVSVVLVLIMFAAPAFATGGGTATRATNRVSVSPAVVLLDPTFSPNAPVGGVPFCSSGGLGTILCYPPSFLKKAYDFPKTTGHDGLDGSGQTIVIVDAFGSPTVQSDLNVFDAAFGLPATTVQVLCGPTWTGAITDNCPVKTVADLFTSPPPGSNADLCGGVGGMVGWAEETTLDVTMSHGLAPGAKIVLLVANDCFDSSIYTAERAVVSQHKYRGSIMSQSFGEPDDLVTCTTLDPTNTFCIANDPTLLNLPNSVFRAATQRHWTIIASSGDDGANTDARVLGTGELTPSFPATSPLVLAAGGTQGNPYGGNYGKPPGKGGTFSCAANTNCNTGLVVINGGPNGCTTMARPGVPSSCTPVGYGGEAAWNEFNVFGLGTSTGGGVSSLYQRPSYQGDLPDSFPTTLGSSVDASGRLVPDVAFNAQIHGGAMAFLGFFGVWAVFGGTSASSPAWAAIVALLNQANGEPMGFINPALYDLSHRQLRFAFHDITAGNNSDTAGLFGVDGFNAGRGYDLTTGWGTPDVSHLIDVLAGQGQSDN